MRLPERETSKPSKSPSVLAHATGSPEPLCCTRISAPLVEIIPACGVFGIQRGFP
jgi:hypothetical protein